MTKKEMRATIDSDILFMMEQINHCIENGFYYSVHDYCLEIRGMLWTANSLGLLKNEEWRIANRMMIHLEYHPHD